MTRPSGFGMTGIMSKSSFIQPFSKSTYQKRRLRLMKEWQREEKSFLAVFWSGSELVRNHDNLYPFRAPSDFLYLTGFAEPESLLLLSCVNGKMKSYFGLRDRDLSPERGSEIWDGERLGVKRAPSHLGVDEAFDIHQSAKVIQKLLSQVGAVYWRFGHFHEWDEKLTRFTKELGNQRKSSIFVTCLRDPSKVLHEHRKIKSAEEIEVMRRSAQIASAGHIRAMQSIRPNQHEFEVQAETEKEFRRLGARCPSYDSICATGNNACVLHYRNNDAKILSSDLMLMDAGAELSGYASDVTRCFPANGKFSEEQAEVYSWVLKAQKAAILAVRPGNHFRKPHEVALKILSEGLSKMKIIRKSGSEIYKRHLYQPYMPHGTSHWLGLDVHDCGTYYDDIGRPLPFKPGQVLTIEPGLYFRKDDKTVPKQYRGIGVRIEDDVLVTAKGRDVLSKDCPKEISEIEALRAPRL